MFKHTICRGLLISAVLPLALLALSGVAEAQSDKSMSSMRPAAQAESPEEKKQKEHKPPKEKAQRQTRDKKLNSCRKNPGCRAKLDAAMKKTPGRKPLPAATEDSPEEAEHKKHAPPEHAGPKPQKRSMLSPTWDEVGSFLSKLSPIQPAMAQGNYSVFVTPTNRFSSSPYGTLYGYFVFAYNNRDYLNAGYNVPMQYCENKSCEYLTVKVPTTGDYIINFSAYNYQGGVGRMRHQWNGPVIEDWNFAGADCNTCNYATVEYLAAGYHTFFFWAPSGYLYVYSASVEPL